MDLFDSRSDFVICGTFAIVFTVIFLHLIRKCNKLIRVLSLITWILIYVVVISLLIYLGNHPYYGRGSLTYLLYSAAGVTSILFLLFICRLIYKRNYYKRIILGSSDINENLIGAATFIDKTKLRLLLIVFFNYAIQILFFLMWVSFAIILYSNSEITVD